MTQRVNYVHQSPELFKKLVEFNQLVDGGAIEQSIRDLVAIRASQLNGCAYCLDMHIKQARIHGDAAVRSTSENRSTRTPGVTDHELSSAPVIRACP